MRLILSKRSIIGQNMAKTCKNNGNFLAQKLPFVYLIRSFCRLSVRFVDIFVVGNVSVVRLFIVDFNNAVCNRIHQFLVV